VREQANNPPAVVATPFWSGYCPKSSPALKMRGGLTSYMLTLNMAKCIEERIKKLAKEIVEQDFLCLLGHFLKGELTERFVREYLHTNYRAYSILSGERINKDEVKIVEEKLLRKYPNLYHLITEQIRRKIEEFVKDLCNWKKDFSGRLLKNVLLEELFEFAECEYFTEKELVNMLYEYCLGRG